MLKRLKAVIDSGATAVAEGGVIEDASDFEPFTVKVPTVVFGYGLSRQALALYVELLWDMEEMSTDGESVKLYKQALAKRAGVRNGKSAYRYLDELKSAGWVKRWENHQGYVRVWVRTSETDSPF
ncbi:hypothetical protein [Nocardia transvalensis]|uniref:hypothetical protein n=1 Tax=Nocardia transvalensis TaxID=37333 RepID=UPI001892EE24|nr:hypothetical protein [Nocardia transvalensis]MBF6330841.1 hypothetical protein [Nocardia transvalensis]